MKIQASVQLVVLSTSDDYQELKILLKEDTLSLYQVELKEELEACMQQTMLNLFHKQDIYLEQLYTSSTIQQSVNHIQISYIVLVEKCCIEQMNSFRWFNVKCINNKKESYVFEQDLNHQIKTENDFDSSSYQMIQLALKRLKNKVEYTKVAFALLPKYFSLLQLQKIYELLLQRKITKQNFRRDIKKILVENKHKKIIQSSGRPASSYQLKGGIYE